VVRTDEKCPFVVPVPKETGDVALKGPPSLNFLTRRQKDANQVAQGASKVGLPGCASGAVDCKCWSLRIVRRRKRMKNWKAGTVLVLVSRKSEPRAKAGRQGGAKPLQP
jgi:hypothetical protein